MIRVENVEKHYKAGETSVHALRGISLTVEEGEFLSIAGPSGSGKTTLLNLIGCLDAADSGSITIDGLPVDGLTPKELSLLRRRKIGFVFQSFNLIPVLTAFENASFPLSLLGVPERELRDRTMRILDEVGLTGMEDRLPTELSGGQQQRVAVARALIKEPSLVLADEPTANLDSHTGEEILRLMRQLNERRETTFIFSTHDQMVMDYALRLVMLRDGQIASDQRRRTEGEGAPGEMPAASRGAALSPGGSA
jgi:putative ABC transport system ATP-binding protein